MLLDLSNRAYVFQYMHVNVTETPIIPYEVDRYYVFGSNKARVSVVGDVVGPLFPTMPVNATSLLDLPMVSLRNIMGTSLLVEVLFIVNVVSTNQCILSFQNYLELIVYYTFFVKLCMFLNRLNS